MNKIINQAPIVRYRASVSEIFFRDSWNGSFSAESIVMPDPGATPAPSPHFTSLLATRLLYRRELRPSEAGRRRIRTQRGPVNVKVRKNLGAL